MAIAIENNALSTIPFFSENQVLRARDLNNLVNAVFEQLRQNRIFNIGLGIVEGFSVSWDEDRGALVVSRGYGVSSDGYAFDLGECTFTHFRRASGLNAGYRELASSCGAYDTLLDKIANAGFELAAPTPTTALLEKWQPLVPGESGGETIPPGSYCLLYLYREAQVTRASCFSDCEARGTDQVGNYHAIVVPVSIDDDQAPGVDSFDIQLPSVPRLPAFGLEEGEIKLCRIRNWADFYASYHSACVAVREKLAAAYGAASLLLEPPAVAEGDPQPDPVDTPLYITTLDLLSRLTEVSFPVQPGTDGTDIQYLYTYCEDLILAYASLYQLLQGQTVNLGNSEASANLDIRCSFSGHLGLRTVFFDGESGGRAIVSDRGEGTDPCRTGRILPDNGEERRNLLDEGKRLFARMQSLVIAGNLLLSTWQRDGLLDARLTPGDRRFPFLRGRALPFYYRVNVMDDWRVGEQPNLTAYRYAERNEDHPLLYGPENWDFYRIEGHLGHPLEQLEIRDEAGSVRDSGVKARIEALRDCLNLAFDVVAVALDEPDGKRRADELIGSDRDLWYKNVRNDILGELIPITSGLKNDGTGGDNPGLILFVEVVDFLKKHAHLTTIDDWQELDAPVDFCAPLPDRLTSLSLDRFVRAYTELVLLIERTRDSGKEDDLLPYLDPELADCVRRAALEERLYQERVWRDRHLAGFSLRHPGLVHWGGVPRGGTFVLVYKSTFDRASLLRLLRSFTDAGNLSDRPDAELIAYARRLQINVDSFRRSEVVADFCLPYLCCGAGPVNLQVITPLPPEPLTLEVRTEPCGNLKELLAALRVTAVVNETGGDLTVTTTDNVSIGSPVRMNALSDTVAFGGLTPILLAGATLDLIAIYHKGDRSVEQSFTVSRRPELIRLEVTFEGRETEDDVNYCLYDLRYEFSPSSATVILENPPAGVTYDPATRSLRVPESIAGQIDRLTLLATSGDCSDRASFDLPPKPVVEIVVPLRGANAATAFTTILNARRNTRRNALEVLRASEDGLTDEEAYKRTYLYVSDTGADAQPNRGLKSALTALAKLRTEEPEREVFVRRTGEILATGFLDKLALAGKREELTGTRQAMLDSLKEGLKELDINPNTVFTEWGVSDLYDGIDRARLTSIGKQLRD